MNKLVVSIAIASVFGLSACGGESIEDVQQEVIKTNNIITPTARIVFDPSKGKLSPPNDLLFTGTKDGTLNIPVVDPTNIADPTVALNGLDGWSISQPFVLGIDFPTGTTLDPGSVFNSSAVRIFETVMGGDRSDADCVSITRGSACKVVGELTFGVDFVAQAKGNSITVVPLKPFKGATSYILALTNTLQDNNGKSVAGSTTYELVRQNISEKPLGNAAQLGLQGAINSYERVIVAAGADSDSLIYTMAMTTQSTSNVLFTVKSMMAANAGQGIVPTIGMADTGLTVADALAGLIPPSLVPLYSTANLMKGSITLPYYSGVPTAENPMAPVNERWEALCDSGAMLAGLAAVNPAAIPEAPLSVADGTCMAISQAGGLPTPGLRDLSSIMALDTERNLTKFSPVPKTKAMMPIDIQMTTPDINVANGVRAQLGLPALIEPENGWPVVMLVHGITSKKEVMLPITGILSLYGMATVAIDHPLHGSRGFDVNMDGTDNINATQISATHYVNLASMLTMRDNTRQSSADLLGLRLGLNFLGGNDSEGNPIKVDTSKVHMLGHSLGAIYAIPFVGLANTSLNPAIDGLFKVASTSLAMPGMMLANFGIESPAFESLIKSNLTYKSSPDFQAFVAAIHPEGPSEDELKSAYETFYNDMLNDSQRAGMDAVFAKFTFASQTVTDSGDPIAYADVLVATNTPIHMIEVVGNGMDNLSDQTVTNTAPNSPMAGTEPLIRLLGLPGISETTQDAEQGVSGVTRFIVGHHNSILDPRPNDASPDAVMSGRATKEMQSQVANFFASMGHLISVQDDGVVQ
ncbi:MAG: Pla-1/cef family extracellular lipase [Alteromonadaceae bacterium]|jgi:Pla-1/cef family extracellular lipase